MRQILRAAVWNPLSWSRSRVSSFGGNYQILRVGIERFGNQQLACLGPVSVGGIDEIGAELHGTFQNLEGIIAIRRPTPDACSGKTHRAKAQPIDRQIAAHPENRVVFRRGRRIPRKDHF